MKIQEQISQVCVVGAGYVGLPIATMVAQGNISVVCFDKDNGLTERINQNKLSIQEPDFVDAFNKARKSRQLIISNSPQPADAYIIAVQTPIKQDFSADLSYIDSAISSIAPYIKAKDLIVIMSTCPVGSTELAQGMLFRERPDLEPSDIHFAYCPERMIPGNVVTELTNNPRIVGGLTPDASQLAKSIFSPFCKGKIIITDARTAEMCKLVENSFRDVNIAFANEISMICREYGVNEHELIQLANEHPRVNVLTPGIGVGGHCLPVDPYFLTMATKETGTLIKTARYVNDSKSDLVYQDILNIACELNLNSIACLGISYKSNTNDPRNSPSISIINKLAERMSVLVADPYYNEPPSNLSNKVSFIDYSTAINKADAIFILVDHFQFSSINAYSKPFFNMTNYSIDK